MLAIIGGTGMDSVESWDDLGRDSVATPYGARPVELGLVRVGGRELVFLPRHGYAHDVPPHRVDYRANLWALKQRGVDTVIAIASVGGIGARFGPGTIAVPDQIVDYTWGREQTYFDGEDEGVRHIDFTRPYCDRLRATILAGARATETSVVDGGTYAATQGPRLETAAEIRRLERDGCDIVGMTGMPEAALARELKLCYAACAVVANWAAGKGSEVISVPEILATMARSLDRLLPLLEHLARGWRD